MLDRGDRIVANVYQPAPIRLPYREPWQFEGWSSDQRTSAGADRSSIVARLGAALPSSADDLVSF